MIKALSIRQPWAWAIIHAGKDIENRSWFSSYRGRFLVHAAKGLTRNEYEDACDCILDVNPDLLIPAFTEIPRGGIVGRAEMIGCVSASKSPWFCGPYGFQLANAEPVEFISGPGALGFFDFAPGEYKTKQPKPKKELKEKPISLSNLGVFQADLFT